MAALLILNYDVTDPDGLAAYRAAAGPLLAAAGERVVRTSDTVDLGEGPPLGGTTVIWRFPSAAAAAAAYRSDAYQAVLRDRLAATTPHFALIVETLDDAS